MFALRSVSVCLYGHFDLLSTTKYNRVVPGVRRGHLQSLLEEPVDCYGEKATKRDKRFTFTPTVHFHAGMFHTTILFIRNTKVMMHSSTERKFGWLTTCM